MKSLFSKYVWLQLILSILLLFGGAVIIAFAINNNTDVLENALNIVVAVILFLFGLFAILTAFVFGRGWLSCLRPVSRLWARAACRSSYRAPRRIRGRRPRRSARGSAPR